MSIKSDLSTLQSNISNVKNKLYTNLTEKGVTTITTASTLSDMADSVTLITTGSTATTETKLVNPKWLIQPDELKDEFFGNTNNYSWLESFSSQILLYPNGDYVFNQDWDVCYYDGNSWVQAKQTDGSDYTTRGIWSAEDFYRLKNDSRYKLAAYTHNDRYGYEGYFTPNELNMVYPTDVIIKPVDKNCITSVSACTYYDFKFYQYNEYSDSYEDYQFINPYNNNEYSFYPIVTPLPYYKILSRSYNEDIEVVGAIITCNSVDDDGILKLGAYRGGVTGEYLLFNHNGTFYDKFSYEFGFTGYRYEYPFDYIAPNVTRLEYVTGNSGITHYHYGFGGSYIDYVGEFVLSDNVTSINDFFTGNYMEYLLIKNIGATDINNHFNFVSEHWGSNEKYSNSRQSLTDSLVTYSYDRVAAGYTNVSNIVLNSRVKARLTEEEIAQITAKGYTIA